jgi:spoIIIJ-associated protein
MAGVEASGKTVEEAIENALAELGVARDAVEVEVEVLSEGRGGVLGVGGSDARVRVRLVGDVDDAGAEAGPTQVEETEFIEDEAEFAAQMLDHLLELMGVAADV